MFKDLERRVKTLENASRVQQLNYLEIRNTSPELSSGGVDLDELTLLLGDDGWELPGLEGMWAKALEAVVVTSSTFVDCWSMEFAYAVSTGFQTTVAWSTDVGTTGRLRLRNNVVGGASTDEIVLAAGTGGFAAFRWRHGQPLGTGPFRPLIEARRVSGAGNVYIFEPNHGRLIGANWIGGTADGLGP
jgi:hypothetical protein